MPSKREGAQGSIIKKGHDGMMDGKRRELLAGYKIF
jgi:hypothetical protein